ncbi:MAG: ribbon-helix-helix domain-containing protein [Rhizobiaceae bacterium]|nr:ribbon-helix-helix domain-containing protein [Rhizobiaceae bacterium]
MSGVRKRSVSLNGHRTSYSIEDEFQAHLLRLAGERGMPLARLIADIDAVPRRQGGLSSALRLHVLKVLEREALSGRERSAAEPPQQLVD